MRTVLVDEAEVLGAAAHQYDDILVPQPAQNPHLPLEFLRALEKGWGLSLFDRQEATGRSWRLTCSLARKERHKGSMIHATTWKVTAHGERSRGSFASWPSPRKSLRLKLEALGQHAC